MSQEVLETYGQKKLDEYSHWTYIIQCGDYYKDFEELERKSEKRLGRKPYWLRPAFESTRLYYIGQTENLEKRLGEHFKKTNGAEFTTLFEPTTLLELFPKRSRNQAEYEEHKRTELYKQSEDVFAYSDKR